MTRCMGQCQSSLWPLAHVRSRVLGTEGCHRVGVHRFRPWVKCSNGELYRVFPLRGQKSLIPNLTGRCSRGVG